MQSRGCYLSKGSEGLFVCLEVNQSARHHASAAGGLDAVVVRRGHYYAVAAWLHQAKLRCVV